VLRLSRQALAIDEAVAVLGRTLHIQKSLDGSSHPLVAQTANELVQCFILFGA